MSAAAPLVAQAIPFGLRREMAKRFGYVEPYGRRGGFCIQFQIEGKRHRISSVELPTGRRIAIRDRQTADEILEEIRGTIRTTGDPIAAIAPYMGDSPLLAFEGRYREWLEIRRAHADAGQISAKRFEELEGHLSRGKLDAIKARPLPAVDYAILVDLQVELLGRYAPKTVHHVLADVRTFLRDCERRRWIARTPEIPITQVPEHIPTIPSREEQRQRLAGIPEADRGYFLARGLLGTRAEETARANVGDYRRGADPDSDEWVIRGKGGRIRPLPVPRELAEWVRKNRPVIAEAETPLFPNATNGARMTKQSMARKWKAMEKALKLAHCKPNEGLRHCFGTRTAERLIAEGMGFAEAEASVKRLMGHSGDASARRYVKLGADSLRGAIE